MTELPIPREHLLPVTEIPIELMLEEVFLRNEEKKYRELKEEVEAYDRDPKEHKELNEPALRVVPTFQKFLKDFIKEALAR